MIKYKNKLQFTLKLSQSRRPVSNFSFTNLERIDYKLCSCGKVIIHERLLKLHARYNEILTANPKFHLSFLAKTIDT